MVGRTPEFLGKKVEAREMKIATIVALLHPFVILVFTAISSYIYAQYPEFGESEGGWLNNPGFHGLSEQLYEYTSSAANKDVYKRQVYKLCRMITMKKIKERASVCETRVDVRQLPITP